MCPWFSDGVRQPRQDRESEQRRAGRVREGDLWGPARPRDQLRPQGAAPRAPHHRRQGGKECWGMAAINMNCNYQCSSMLPIMVAVSRASSTPLHLQLTYGPHNKGLNKAKFVFIC